MHQRKWISLALTVGALATYSGESGARSTPAALGHTALGSQASCIRIDFNTGAAINDCGVQIDWELGLPLDTFGAHSGFFTVEVFDSGLTACRVIGIGRNGIGFSGTSFKSAPHPGVSTDLTWSGVQVPTSGLMFVDCFMGPHARFSKNEHTPN